MSEGFSERLPAPRRLAFKCFQGSQLGTSQGNYGEMTFRCLIYHATHSCMFPSKVHCIILLIK